MRIATNLPISKQFTIILVLQILTIIFLLMIALGIFLKPTASHFAVGLTAIVLIAICGYLITMEMIFFEGAKSANEPRSMSIRLF